MPELKVPALEKLVDYAASGIGAVAGPMLLPYKASMEAKARLIGARADADVRLIEAKSEAETVPIIVNARAEAHNLLVSPGANVSSSVEISRDEVFQRVEFQERKRQSNIRSAIQAAAADLGDKEVDEHEPDLDWVARYFNYVQDVSSDDIRQMWSKILAGEVERPGRTSLRTLDILRNMTRGDAQTFSRYCNFVIVNQFMFYERSSKDQKEFDVGELLHLQECGLLDYGSDVMRQIIWCDKREMKFAYHNYMMLITRSSAAEDIITIPAIPLTTAGTELCQLVQGTAQDNYLRRLSTYLKSKSCELFRLENSDILPDGTIFYTNRISI